MATIEWQKMPPRRGGEGKQDERLFPRMKNSEVVDLDAVCEKIAGASVFSRAELQAAFILVVDGIREQLAEGRTVDIRELGTFRLNLGTEGVVTTSTRQRMNRLRVEGINFRASSEMLQGIGKPHFKAETPARVSSSLSAQDLVAPLTDYFHSHDSITRQTLQQLFGLPHSTAALRLQQLIQMGILKAEGENRHRIYRLVQ